MVFGKQLLLLHEKPRIMRDVSRLTYQFHDVYLIAARNNLIGTFTHNKYFSDDVVWVYLHNILSEYAHDIQ